MPENRTSTAQITGVRPVIWSFEVLTTHASVCASNYFIRESLTSDVAYEVVSSKQQAVECDTCKSRIHRLCGTGLSQGEQYYSIKLRLSLSQARLRKEEGWAWSQWPHAVKTTTLRLMCRFQADWCAVLSRCCVVQLCPKNGDMRLMRGFQALPNDVQTNLFCLHTSLVQFPDQSIWDAASLERCNSIVNHSPNSQKS